MKLMPIIALMVFLISGTSNAASLDHSMALDDADFSVFYQSNVEPWEAYPCKHVKASVGVFEWDVYCKVGTVVHKIGMHLVLSYYPRTIYGGSGYELLYWLTDWTHEKPQSHSTTIWFHQSKQDATSEVIEAALGVENDLASLRLKIAVPHR